MYILKAPFLILPKLESAIYVAMHSYAYFIVLFIMALVPEGTLAHGAGDSTAKCLVLRSKHISTRLEGIASRLEAIAIRFEANASRLEAIALRLEAIASRLEAIALRLEAIPIGRRQSLLG